MEVKELFICIYNIWLKCYLNIYNTYFHHIIYLMIAFSIWPVDIYRYGIMYALSIVIQLYRFHWIARHGVIAAFFPQAQKIITTHLDSLLTVIVLGIIVWGRIWHVFIYERWYYSQNLLQILNLQGWGMSFVGGFIGVVVGVIWFLWYYRFKFVDGLVIWDLICTLLPFNIMFGRFANRLNQELYGRIVDLWLRSASQIEFLQSRYLITLYPHIDQQLRRNTNLIEWISEGLLLWICTSIIRWGAYRNSNQIKAGKVVVVFMICYSIIRFCVEWFRDNPATEFVGWRNKSQLWMLCMGLIGVWLLFYIKYYQTWPRASS